MTWTQQCGPRNFCCFLFTPAVYECQDKLFPCTGSSCSSHPADSFCPASSQPPLLLNQPLHPVPQGLPPAHLAAPSQSLQEPLKCTSIFVYLHFSAGSTSLGNGPATTGKGRMLVRYAQLCSLCTWPFQQGKQSKVKRSTWKKTALTVNIQSHEHFHL